MLDLPGGQVGEIQASVTVQGCHRQQTYPFAGITRIRFEGSLRCTLPCCHAVMPAASQSPNGTPLGLSQRYQKRRLGAEPLLAGPAMGDGVVGSRRRGLRFQGEMAGG